MEFTVKQIGVIRADDTGFRVVLDPPYAPALLGLAGFRHIHVLWWFSQCDSAQCRGNLQEESPYRHGPSVLGTFATRTPMRPNPLALSCAEITYIDEHTATIGIAYLDADDGSPVLDIKPYTPSLDRVADPGTPEWCAGWPRCIEDAESFDWASVFQFE